MTDNFRSTTRLGGMAGGSPSNIDVASARGEVDTVRDCDYWKPIAPGGIALPCNCGMNCDGPRQLPEVPHD